MRKLKSLFLIFILLFLSFFILVKKQNSIWAYLGSKLIIENELNKADIILILGGSVIDRTLEAVKLYRNGYSEKIVIVKNYPPSGYYELERLKIDFPRHFELKQNIAIKSGVKNDSFIVIDQIASNTYEESLIIYDYMIKNEYNSMIVVTSKSHMKRASMIFNDNIRDEINIYFKGSEYDGYGQNEAKYRFFWKEILYEYQKIIFYNITKLFSLGYPHSG